MSNITEHIAHFEKGLSALRLEVDASIVESLFILFEPIKAALQSDNPNEASAIEIFKKHGAHYYEDDENDIIAAMIEYRKQGRFYTEEEINEIQSAAYDAGMNYVN